MHLVCYSCLPIVTLVSLLLHCRRPTPRSRVCHLRPFLSRSRLIRQCLRRCRHCCSRTNPTRHSLPRLCRCRARCHRCCRLLLNRIRMQLLESPGTPRIERHCSKPHRDSASQRHRVSKSAHFSPMPSYFSRSVAALEIAGVLSSLDSSDPRKPRRFADRMSLTLSRHMRNFEMD